MKVGLVLPISDDDGSGAPAWSTIRERARQAEGGGADSVWVYDHLIFRRDGVTSGIHEAWTILSAVALTTRRVEIGTIVLGAGFRSPALLAKMATTLDAVSGGRLILGLGCGWHEPEYQAFGYPFDHRVGRFEEALRIIAPLVRDGRVTFEGRWHQVVDCEIAPRGPRPTGPPIMIAARGERMLRLTAEHADLWNAAWFGLPDERLAGRIADLQAALAAVGRDPGKIGMTVGVTVKPDQAAAGGRPGAPVALSADPGAIAAALGAYEALEIVHVQLDVQPATRATFDAVLKGIRRWRAGAATAGAPDPA